MCYFRSFVLEPQFHYSFLHSVFKVSTGTLAGEAGEYSNSFQLWFHKNYPGLLGKNSKGGLCFLRPLFFVATVL